MAEASTVSLGTFVPRDKLGLDFKEQELRYLDAEFAVTATPESNGATRYDVGIDHGSLHARQLINLLGQISGRTDGREPFLGIIADWDVVDRAKTETRSPYAANLVDLHQHLGDSWQEFMRSRGRWLSILVNEEPPRFGSRHAAYGSPFRRKDLVGIGTLAADTARARTESIDALIAGFETTGIDDAHSFVVSSIQTAINRNRNPHRQLSDEFKIRRHFGSMNPKTRENIIKRMFAGLEDHQVKALVDAVSDAIYETIDTDEGCYYIPKANLSRPFDESMSSAKVVRKGMFEAMIVDLIIDRKHVHAMVPGSLKSDDPATTVAPLLSWRNVDGQREFIIERRTEHTDGLIFHDGVLGIMLAAYLSPDVTKDWPRTMSIRGSREQVIGAAQVPVLALMRRAQLLKTDFVEAAEEVAS